jgi:hypothetical protein
MVRILVTVLFCFVFCILKGISPVIKNRQLPTTGCKSISTNYHLHAALNRPAYYKAMKGDNKELVNAQLKELSSAPPELKDAFVGAMTMKKAGIGGSPITKLHLFKVGHKLLEDAINNNPKNAEFRFLRLMIQENAPEFMGYKSDTEKDSEYIRKSYKLLPEDVQNAITDYNKKSKLLKLEVS